MKGLCEGLSHWPTRRSHAVMNTEGQVLYLSGASQINQQVIGDDVWQINANLFPEADSCIHGVTSALNGSYRGPEAASVFQLCTPGTEQPMPIITP